MQEALTNVRRHSGATQCRVGLAHLPQSLQIEVVDNGAGPPAESVEGHGLIGMRERALLYGGEFSAGPDQGGGFRVRARLPVPA